MMVDGVSFPLGEALRPLGLWRPSTRTWRQQNVGSRPRCIGDRKEPGAHEEENGQAGASASSPSSRSVW